MASTKGNILLNGINTVTGIIFPVITFPYAARILLPAGIGTINFLNSIIDYIILLTSLGIPMYAIKEVAKCREDKDERDKVTIEILLLSILLCVVGYFIVFILAKFIPQIHQQSGLFYILSLSIGFTAIGVNWFYQGIEDFKFITIRAIIIRTLSAIALFIFVKTSSDIMVYGIIIVASTVGNNFINFVNLKNYINFKKFQSRDLRILRHLKPAVQIFFLNLITSLYVQINTLMIGFISGEEAVGIYTGGIKITSIAQRLILSIGMVIIPHCTSLVNKGEIDSFKSMINKNLNLIQFIAIPLLVGSIILARPIIMTFCGPNFEGSVIVFLLDSPLMVIACLSNLIAMQVLFTQDKMNVIFKSLSIGALTNILLNIMLIPTLSAAGAAIAANVTEIIILVSLFVTGHKYIPFQFSHMIKWRYVILSGIMAIFVLIITFIFSSNLLQLIIGIPTGFIVYTLLMHLSKDSIYMEILNWIRPNLDKVLNK